MTVLERLEEGRVLAVRLHGDHLMLGECCDHFFSLTLNKAAALEMLSSIQALVDQLPDTGEPKIGSEYDLAEEPTAEFASRKYHADPMSWDHNEVE